MDLIKIFSFSWEMIIGLDLYNISLLAFILIPVVIYLIFFILEGVGLYTMASAQGVRYKWRAFVPFLNSYLMGELTGDCPFCGKKIKSIKVWILCAEIVAFITGALYIICECLLASELFKAFRREVIDIYMGFEVITYEYDVSSMSGWRLIIYNISQVDYYVYLIFNLVYLVFYIILLTNFFRKYFAKNYFMLVLACVLFPIQGACIFAVRNNKPVDYNEYINKRRAQYFNQNRNGYNNYYSNRNNGGSSNGRGGYNYDPFTGQPVNHNTSNDDPFSEFGDSNGNTSSGNNGNGSTPDDDDPFGL